MAPQEKTQHLVDPLAATESTNSNKSCEDLYGPYPSASPRPFVDKEGTVGTANDADYRDVGTPDEWLPRDGRLIRLTGRHPFNVEPPVDVLHSTRFLTPSSVHYVRNHGACPQLDWNTHTLTMSKEGTTSTDSNVVLSMNQLAALQPTRELPVTLVCAGNRRKEQNMMRQTIGFHWGSSGVSTNVYKGILLRDLLLQTGLVAAEHAHNAMAWQGWHVEMVGVEDLPNKVGPGPFVEQGETWGKTVKYGTSIPLARAMNPAYDVMVAYEANGQRLLPDHGFPVRMIIPGYIGGRMIKWLASIKLIPHETYNHYHYHDNRILPPHITAEKALQEGWWYKPEYIFNELNINSALTAPNHGETLPIAKNVDKEYTVSGYAYTGGGRKITRVEISTNGGHSWELATVERTERPTPYDMHWCWIWFDYSCKVSDLMGASEIWCRAWDESNNTQPLTPTWNLMGMGNNNVFKVKIHLDKTASGEHVFRFEHPTQAGQQPGGWMTRMADKPVSAGFGKLLQVLPNGGMPEEEEVGNVAPTAPKMVKLYTMQEVAKHNTEEDVWIIINNKVYDCTEYLELHPGGIDSITINAGADATEDFVAIHSTKATKMLEKYYIGDLDVSSIDLAKKAAEEAELTDAQGRKLALNPRKKTPFTLQNKVVLSRDSFMLDFALPSKDHILGLPTGKHMFFSAVINGETVVRRYTPISSNYDVGCVKFVIKAYRPCERFPEGGKMSQYVDQLKIGDTLDFRGPVGEFEYLQTGDFLLDGEARSAQRFNFIAGGTGITPCMQIAAEILRHPSDPTQMSLIFACREEGDLLMRSTLDEWAAKFPDKFKVHYILSDSWAPDWKYSTGFVDKKLFEEHLYPPSEGVYNLMCGPPIMLDRGCTPNLKALGHEQSHIFSF